jgi:hypothetical protein
MQNQWLSECLQGDAILAALSESNRTPGGVSNTVEEVYVNHATAFGGCSRRDYSANHGNHPWAFSNSWNRGSARSESKRLSTFNQISEASF